MAGAFNLSLMSLRFEFTLSLGSRSRRDSVTWYFSFVTYSVSCYVDFYVQS